MNTTQLYARESVAFDHELIVRDTNGQPVDVSGWSFALALQRKAGAIDIDLGPAVNDDQGIQVVDGISGAVRVVVSQASLQGIDDTTGKYLLFGDLLGSSPAGRTQIITPVQMEVTAAGQAFGDSGYQVVLEAVGAAIIQRVTAIAEAAAAAAEAFTGPTYLSTTAGLDATEDGQGFAVNNGNGTFSVYLNDGGTAVIQRTVLTSDKIDSTIEEAVAGVIASTEDIRDATIDYRDETLGYRDDVLQYRDDAEAFADAAQDTVGGIVAFTLAGLQDDHPADGTNPVAYIFTGADEGIYEDTGAWERRGDTQAVRAKVEADKSAQAAATSRTAALLEAYPIVRWARENDVNLAIYNPNDLTTMFQDTAGTVPVTEAGQTVRLMKDVTGNGNDLTRTSGANPPILRKDEWGGYYVDVPIGGLFTTADFSGTTGAYSYSAAYTVAAVAQTQSGSGTRTVFGIEGAEIVGRTNANDFAAAGLPDRSRASRPGVPAPSVLEAGRFPDRKFTSTNGGSLVPPLQYEELINDFGALTQKTEAFAPRTGKYIGLCNNNRSVYNTQCNFFGGMVVIDAVPPPQIRAAAIETLRSWCGVKAVDDALYDIFMIAGQSNAMGSDTDGSQAPSVPLGQGAAYTDRGFLRPMRDSTLQHMGRSGSTGNCSAAFCNSWHSRTKGRVAAVVGAGASGCGIFISGPQGNWGPNGTLVRQAAEKLRTAVSHVSTTTRGGVVRGIIWAGGEQDTGGLTSGALSVAEYKASLVSLRDRFRQQSGFPLLDLYIVSADRQTVSTDDVGYARLRQAQAEAAAENDGIYLVVPYQDFVGQGKMGSQTHWNQIAQNEVGTIAASNIATILGWPA